MPVTRSEVVAAAGWNVVALLLVLWAAVLPAGARDEAVVPKQFTGFGPLPARNFQPIQLIFLNLPFESARVLAPGHFTLRLESAESNVIATDQGPIDAVLKFETNRTVFGGTLGVRPGFELGLDIPFLSRFGGFLDPIIDTVEDAFGRFNPERSLFPNNTFGAFIVERGDTVLFEGQAQTFEIGDIWISGKHEVWAPDERLLVSLRGAVKAPTGSASGVFGSGKPDFGLGVAADYQALDWLVLYGNVAGVFPTGPIADGNLTLNPFVSEGFALEARLLRWASVVFQQELYSSPIHGTGSSVLQGTVIELALGFNAAWGPLLFQLGGINNVSGVAQAADFTLLGRMTYHGAVH